MRQRLYSIQLLRAFACLSVIISHAIGRAGRVDDIQMPELISIYPEIVIFGHFGVDLFFIISGFIMYLVHSNDFSVQGAPRKFIVSRMIRVVPIYWLLSLVALITLYFFPSLFSYREEIEVFWVLGSFLFFPSSTSYGLDSPLIGVGWSLNYEIFFYLCFATVLFLRKSIGLSLLFVVFSLLVIFGGNSSIKSTKNYFELITSPLLLEFLLGIVAAYLFVNYRPYLYRFRYVFISLALICLFCSLLNIPLNYIDRYFSWGLPSMLLLVGFSVLSFNINNVLIAAGVKFGDISYSAYLIQVFSLPLLSKIFFYFNMQIYFGFYSYIALLVMGTILCSYFFWLHVERPLTRFLTNKFR